MKEKFQKIRGIYNTGKILVKRGVSYILQIVHKIKFVSSISALVWPENLNNYADYADLAPVEEVSNGTKYFNALDWALNNEKIRNIAISGPYGSGKSSLIKSYIKKHPELSAITISLASFTKNEDKKLISYEEEELELAILKQLFYAVNYRKIPQSRYRKLYRIRKRYIFGKVILGIMIVALGSTFFVENIRDHISRLVDTAVDNMGLDRRWVLIIGIGVCLACVYSLAYVAWKWISRIRLKEVNVADHAKLATDTDSESILNKNLDEIVYFFEETGYSTVFIEDLDRFSVPEIFVKLREINTILNQYEMIKRRIVFIYAIKDDIFTEVDRTKFFDYILPIIPIINATNSGEKLLERLQDNEGNMKFEISMEYVMLIAPFIEDMRVLNNICNDFIIYRETLCEEEKLNLSDQLMFSLMVFKNLYPKDFADLQAEKGIVKEAFDKKKELILTYKNEFEENIQHCTKEIGAISNEVLRDVREVKTAMLYYMTGMKGAFNRCIINGTHTFGSIMEDQFNLELLRGTGTVYYYSGGSTANTVFEGTKMFTGQNDYIERCKRVGEEGELRKQELQEKIERETYEMQKISAMSFKEIALETKLLDYLPESVKNNELLVFLLRNGFIDETYDNYMNHFHEKSITKADKNFILSVRNRKAELFDYKLTRIEQVTKSLMSYEYEQKEIYNFDLLDYLLENRFESVECSVFIKQLSDEHEVSWKFINEYVDQSVNVARFIEMLGSAWAGIWDYICCEETLSEQRRTYFLELICKYVHRNNIGLINGNNGLTKYFVANSDILKRMKQVSFKRMEEIIRICQIKFVELDIVGVDSRLLDFVFDENYYVLTERIIKSICGYKKPELIASLSTANFTTVRALGYNPLFERVKNEIDAYVENIILGHDENTQESIESVLELIKMVQDEDTIKRLIRTQNVCLDLLEKCNFEHLKYIEKLEIVWNEWILCDKLQPKWENINTYLIRVERTPVIIKYIENHVDELLLDEISSVDFRVIGENMIYSDIREDVFEKIMQKSPITTFELSFKNVKKEILHVLINLKYIEIMPEKVDELKEVFPELVVTYVICNKERVLDGLEDYSFDSGDIESFIDSAELSEIEKLKFVDSLENAKITEKIARFLSSVTTTISKEQFVASWEILDKNRKSDIFLNQIELLSKEEISERLSELSGEYKSLADRSRRHEEILSDTIYNRRLVEYLKKIDYLTSYVEQKRDEEDIITHKVKQNQYLLCRIKKE